MRVSKTNAPITPNNLAKAFADRTTTNWKSGPMPNVMAALPNIVAPSVQRRKVWMTPNT